MTAKGYSQERDDSSRFPEISKTRKVLRSSEKNDKEQMRGDLKQHHLFSFVLTKEICHLKVEINQPLALGIQSIHEIPRVKIHIIKIVLEIIF